MQLSDQTLTILKNFAAINQGIVIKPGNVLRTVSLTHSLMAEATVPDYFDRKIVLYDLSKMLAIIQSSPDIEIEDNQLVLIGMGGKAKTYIRFSFEGAIVQPPASHPKVDDYELKFELLKNQFQWIMQTASILKCPTIIFSGDKETGEVKVSPQDHKGVDVDSGSLSIGSTNLNEDIKVVIKLEDMKMIPGTYEVSVSKEGLAKFEMKEVGANTSITYWSAGEVNV